MKLNEYKIQFTRTVQSMPESVNLYGKSKTEVQTKFWGMNPTFFIVSTVELIYK